MSDYIDWPDNTGRSHRYWFHATPRDAATIKNEPGNYVFVRRQTDGSYLPLYFGIADSLKNRVPNHERWNDAIRAGVTHVMMHTTQGGEQVRAAEERALIARWNPPLNTHHRRAV